MQLFPSSRTLIMGILNVTPDSFYDGGRFFSHEKALERGMQMADDGADIIDVGGESTRPGAEPVRAGDEIERVCPVIEKLAKKAGIPVSVDTYKSEVAREALRCGAVMVNDISGLEFDDEIAGTAARGDAYLVVSHIRGTPGSMQDNPVYDNLLEDIYSGIRAGVDKALAAGIKKEKIIIDPGIGFGKTQTDNYVIINGLSYFRKMGFPLLVGLSRKSLIGRLYDEDSDRLPGTIALNAAAVLSGADMIRVHDVREHVLAIKAIDMLKINGGSDGRSIR